MRQGVESFPRGFLLSLEPVEPPPGFVPGPVLPNFYVHPWAAVEHAADHDGWFVVIVGTCVSTITEAEVGAADVLLGALRTGEQQLLAALSRYSGRHAVFYGRGDHVRVLSDATAMRSIFYAASGGLVASHAHLVESALGGDFSRNDLPFKYGYPGNRTPYPRTRLLTANTLYELTEGRVRRFWPTLRPERYTAEEAASLALDGAVTALRNVAKRRPVKLALTAGLDSRAMLAVVLRSGVEFEAYTYGTGDDTLRDRVFAADLAATVGARHSALPAAKLTDRMAAALTDAHYDAHHKAAVASLMNWFEDRSAVAVTANLLEIGRSFYKKRRDNGAAPPTTAASMANLYYLSAEGRAKSEMKALGRDRYLELASHGFQEFIETTQYATSDGLLDPFDQFYWEHRMSAWHGTAMVERDFYAEAFIPFNTRTIFEAMLGVAQPDRDSGAVLHHLIRQVEPRLLDLPINPDAWPPASTQAPASAESTSPQSARPSA